MLDKNAKNKVSFKDVAGCDEAKVRRLGSLRVAASLLRSTNDAQPGSSGTCSAYSRQRLCTLSS
jgi:hypothetical protein